MAEVVANDIKAQAQEDDMLSMASGVTGTSVATSVTGMTSAGTRASAFPDREDNLSYNIVDL